MTADDELEGELRRLFGDARLDVIPREGAEDAVVTGARRIRRRRTAVAATGGVLTAVVLVAGGLVLGGLRTGTDQVAAPLPTQPVPTGSETPSMMQPAPASPSGTTQTSITSGAASPPSTAQSQPSTRKSSSTVPPSSGWVPPDHGSVLGPSGYGPLRLGMSFDEAKATGMLLTSDTTAPAKCTAYWLTEGSYKIFNLIISPDDGIVLFQADAGAHTPENIKKGSTLAQLQAAYPDLVQGTTTWTASAGSGSTYVFFVNDQDVVTKFQLTAPGAANC